VCVGHGAKSVVIVNNLDEEISPSLGDGVDVKSKPYSIYLFVILYVYNTISLL
jgi:hypothetical protein